MNNETSGSSIKGNTSSQNESQISNFLKEIDLQSKRLKELREKLDAELRELRLLRSICSC